MRSSSSRADGTTQDDSDDAVRQQEIRRPSVIIVATVHWASTTRLSLAMAEGGFDVRVIAPDDHAAHGMSGLAAERIGSSRAEALATIASCVRRYKPDLLVPGDELAISYLRRLYARAVRGRGSDPRAMADLIEASLGAPSSFAFGYQKSRLVSLAKAEGLLVPDTLVVRSIDAVRRLAEKSKFPLVLKHDESFGGRAVRVVGGVEEAVRAFAELQSSASRLAALKQVAKKLDWAYLDRLWLSAPAITMQRYVDGRPANRAVACSRGEVLAGLSVEVLQTVNAVGPATVVRVVESADMSTAAIRLVRRLGLSGFVGFDFVLEAASGRPFLIEMNTRPTQICHLALDAGSDMIGALLGEFCGAVQRRMTPNVGSRTVALFPQESWRDPASEYLSSAYHDVPWQLPEFVLAYRRPIPTEPSSWLEAARQHARRLSRAFNHPAATAPAAECPSVIDHDAKSLAPAKAPVVCS